MLALIYENYSTLSTLLNQYLAVINMILISNRVTQTCDGHTGIIIIFVPFELWAISKLTWSVFFDFSVL